MVQVAPQRYGDNPSEFCNGSIRNIKRYCNVDPEAVEHVRMTHISWSVPSTAPHD